MFPRARFTLVLATLVMGLCGSGLHAQAYLLLKGKEAIPRESYKSWSLFLVTNQDWLIADKMPELYQLYQRSEAFGRVIGRDHLAVWFWKATTTWVPAISQNVDVERAIAFCEKLGLRPSGGPYLLFTTTYPEEGAALKDYSVIELGKQPAETIKLLNRLGDQLVTEGVIREGSFRQPVGTDDFWRAWFDATRNSLTALGFSFRASVRTPTLSLDTGGR